MIGRIINRILSDIMNACIIKSNAHDDGGRFCSSSSLLGMKEEFDQSNNENRIN